ncbi:ParA family protein [Candidatus Dependentiae bacterium]|nr:ParA family protein [Candidatus Dependentiae bacterium]
MRMIAVANHKGGVGKSTTVINLGAALALLGKKVLLIDTDPQGHTTLGLGVKTKEKQTLAELLCQDDVLPEDVIQNTYIKGLDIIPSDLSLSVAEMKLSTMTAKEFKLRNKLRTLTGYDIIIFDCAPTFGALPMNVFTTATEVILPIQLGYFSLEGVSNFIDTLQFINKNVGPIINHEVGLSGVLITFYDIRTKLAREVLASVHETFNSRVFETTIPQNIKLNEAQSNGKAIFDYDADCKGAEAYMNLAKELLTTKKGNHREQHIGNK